jgi:hypothetical protein
MGMKSKRIFGFDVKFERWIFAFGVAWIDGGPAVLFGPFVLIFKLPGSF